MGEPTFEFPSPEMVKQHHANSSQSSIHVVFSSNGDDEEGGDQFETVHIDPPPAHSSLPTESSAAEEGLEEIPIESLNISEDVVVESPATTPPLSPSVTSTAPSSNSKVNSPPPLHTSSTDDTTATPKQEQQQQQALSPPTSPTIQRRPSTASPTKGASVLQKTVSMTRQRDLPPKDKEQEKKHLRELDEMLAASREAEKRRELAKEAALEQRNQVLAAALSTWETSILPNWRVVHRDTALRDLWWAGTMPSRRRGQLWGLCIGNNLAIGKGTYGIALSRAKKAIEAGRYPEIERQKIQEDCARTMRRLKLFQEGGVMHDELVDVLLAYTVALPEERSYPKGLAYPAALLLLNMSPAETFLSLVNLVEKSFLKSFYGAKDDEMDAYFRIFDTLLADFMPKVYANFSQEGVRPSIYLTPWLTTTFAHFLPLDTSTRLFDVFLLEGDSFLFRVALALLQILEPRLFNPVRAELAAVFAGEDRGAVAVVRRESGKDEKDDVEAEEVFVEMGCTEERLFEELGKLDWKEETWDRLVARELPEAD